LAQAVRSKGTKELTCEVPRAAMATARPVVSVYKCDDPSTKSSTLPMPIVLCSPLRPDIVRSVYTNMSKNKRQAYALSPKAGYHTAAESWGTGRAVARIPRVPGGGTHRAGQAAFGNMCRGGGMFAPTKVWRRWHRRVNVTLKRHAVAVALASSTLPPLVMARGHKLDEVAELPLVVTDDAEKITKTKDAVKLLHGLGCQDDLDHVSASRKARGGVAKLRNRKYTMRRGPIVIYNKDDGIVRAFRNIPGVETACVDRLNLLKLAPGGSFGRFVIFTEGAFKKLNEIYGTHLSGAPAKKGYHLLRPQMENADIARIINSDEVQKIVKPKLEAPKKYGRKKNPLKNHDLMENINPGSTDARKARAALHTKKKGKPTKKDKKLKLASKKYFKDVMGAFEEAKAAADAAAKADKRLKERMRAGKLEESDAEEEE